MPENLLTQIYLSSGGLNTQHARMFFGAMELLSFYLLCFCSLLPSSFLRLLDEMGPAMLMAVPVLLLLPPTTSNPQPTNPHFPEKDHF